MSGCLLCLSVVSVSCGGNQQRVATALDTSSADSVVQLDYAHGFTIRQSGGTTFVSVLNPWQGAHDKEFCYALCPKDAPLPEGLSGYTVIRTPVERVICLSTTHVAMLKALGRTSSIKALSGSAFVYDADIQKAVADKMIPDVGYDTALDFEKIIALKPDAVFAYGVGQEVLGSLTKLTDLGIKVVLNAEYLEQTALGKAEWLKFMATFYRCEAEAAVLFENIKQEYESLKLLAANEKNKPKIMCDLPWKGTWYIPGGKTSIAEIIADAGGDFLWKENDSHESYPVDIEAIIDKGALADLWIHTGTARSLYEIKSVDERLAHARPWKTGNVFNNYARTSAGGGNDFFESGVIQPQVVLKDLIKIFHPDLLPNHSLYYYVKLN
ncbi:MAG: ABC transporter substrate-binding protein [Bacteroidales bacterium]|nr:ABC transporter substrate-binding protein [Bacteroidales bacterium]